MSRVILLLAVALAFLMPLVPATAQVGPMRGPAAQSAAPAAEETVAPMRWLAARQRDAALSFRKLLIDLRAEHTWGTLATAVGVAFLYGILHAAGPGHGKMIVIAYFLARRARLRDGLWMGVRIALTHVAAALAIVLILFLLFNGRPGPDFENAREIRLIAYAGMIALGLWFLIEAAERLRSGAPAPGCGHDHGDRHGHDPGPHLHPSEESPPAARWRARVTGMVAGAVPCTGAILVLVFCAANGLWLAGLLMVGAIALGMALTMTGLGVVTLLARDRMRRWAERHPPQGSLRVAAALAGPAFVTLGGIALLALSL